MGTMLSDVGSGEDLAVKTVEYWKSILVYIFLNFNKILNSG